MKKNNFILPILIVTYSFLSCNDFLDKEPIDSLAPTEFFNNDAELQAYVVSRYVENFKTYSGYGLSKLLDDDHTDNQVNSIPNYNLWVPGFKKVPQTDKNGWNFSRVRKINYFLSLVLPKYSKGEIRGNMPNIKHSIGEAYLLRAYDNYKALVRYGDFPIIEEVVPDDPSILQKMSKRSPRNLFARFILKDCDKAIEFMNDNPIGGTNRLTQRVAYLLKSRIALFEGSWLKYHKGTPRVPMGPNWPGKDKEYNKDYTINIDQEIKWFFQQAADAAYQVAEKVQLTPNSHQFNPDYTIDSDGTPIGEGSGTDWNPYFEMFSSTDMSKYNEVLFWRSYNGSMAANSLHSISTYLYTGGGTGLTKNLIDSYLMKNGLPYYAPDSMYQGDSSIEKLKENRDERLSLFVSSPSDVGRLKNSYGIKFTFYNEPAILNPDNTKMVTGYNSRKYLTYDVEQIKGNGLINTYGCLIFRGVEAYLNYMEASYELTGNIDATADRYWKLIRQRAGISMDYQITIQNTDLTKENDWAVYSSGKMIDKTLYNIRRERRIELMQEGFRWDDLKRWAALETVKEYVVQGFNLWGEDAYANKYVDENTGKSKLICQGMAGIPNVSSKLHSGNYLCPYQINKVNNPIYWGYTWSKANYLNPIPIEEIQLAASDPEDLNTSNIYQNPGWGLEAGSTANDND